MIKFYAGRITRGFMTIIQVPVKWRADVQAMIDGDNNVVDLFA